MANKQTVKICIYDGEVLMGILTISSDAPFDRGIPKFSPEDGICLDNIPIDDVFDDVNPIQYCIIPNKSANIYLLEETEYSIRFEPTEDFLKKDKISVLKELETQKFLDEDGEKSKSKFTIERVGDIWICYLNFKSYSGSIPIDIRAEGFEYKLDVTVRTKKLDYNEEYGEMISDLAEYSSGLLFNNNALLYQSHELARNKKNTKFEYYMLLELIFRPKNLPAVFEYLSRNLYSKLEQHKELVPTPFASNIGPAEIMQIISNPQDVQKVPCNHSIMEKNGKCYVPARINETRYEDTIDTPENRFLKYFLEYVRNKINTLLKDVGDGHVKDDLVSFYDKTNYYLSQRFFRDISNLTYIPLNSQVLQKKEGYKDIFKYFLMLELGTNITFDDVNDILKGYQRPLSTLYEFWCYFQLIEIVNSLTDTEDNVESFIDTERWSLNLDNIKILDDHFKPIYINGKNIKITLMYHMNFEQDKKDGEDKYYSYSLPLEPDYTLPIEYDNVRRFIHFDAKYKVDYKNKKKYNSADVHKMHAYKDGIYNSIGAYILYPGDSPPEKFEKNVGAFESVGAFCLKPGKNKKENQKVIEKIIKEIIDEVTKPKKSKRIDLNKFKIRIKRFNKSKSSFVWTL